MQTTGQQLSLEHQLALVTCIRKQFTVSDDQMPEVAEVIENTTLLNCLHQILSFQSSEEEVYFLKLEALWIVTNLGFTDRVSTMRIFASSLADAHSMTEAELL